ncbi:MAG: PEGA domain-containing protein, partial [Acidobacteriota bacterium]
GRIIVRYNPRGLNRNTGEMKLRNYATYYAPELFVLDAEVDARADIYSLGALCYHMLSGLPPFTNDNSIKGPIYIIDDPRPLLMLRQELEIPNSLEKLMLKALSRDPAKRQNSLEEFIESLQEICFDLSVLIPSSTKMQKKEREREKLPTSQLIEESGEGSEADNLIEITDLEPIESSSDSISPPAAAMQQTPTVLITGNVPQQQTIPNVQQQTISNVPPYHTERGATAISTPPIPSNIAAPKTLYTHDIRQQTSTITTPSQTKTALRRMRPQKAWKYWLMFATAGLALLFITGIVALALFQAPVGSIIIKTAPAGAQIVLDGRSIGQAPAKIENVPVGSHRIKLSKDGFSAIEVEVKVDKKQTHELPLLSLQPNRPQINLAGTPEERIKEFTRLAEEAYARGDYVTPEDSNTLYYCNAVLVINPNETPVIELRARVKEALFKQAQTAEQKNDLATAQQIYNQLVEKFPEDTTANEALKRVQAQLEQRRGQIAVLLQDGEAALSAGRLIEPPGTCAYYYAVQILAIERNNPAGQRLRMRVKEAALKEAEQLTRNDLKAAIEKYDKLTRLFPEDRRIYNQIRLLNEQIALQAANSNDPKKRRDAGIQKYTSGDYASAATELEAAVKLGAQDADTLYYLAAANWKRGRLAEAIRYFNQVLDQNPKYAAALAALGQIAEQRNETTSAISYYEKAIQAGGSGEYSIAYLRERVDTLKASLKPKTPEPEPFRANVTHDHAGFGFLSGSCKGLLEVSSQGVRYLSTNNPKHNFAVALKDVYEINPKGDELSFKTSQEKYKFKFSGKLAERFMDTYYQFFRLGQPQK